MTQTFLNGSSYPVHAEIKTRIPDIIRVWESVFLGGSLVPYVKKNSVDVLFVLVCCVCGGGSGNTQAGW